MFIKIPFININNAQTGATVHIFLKHTSSKVAIDRKILIIKLLLSIAVVDCYRCHKEVNGYSNKDVDYLKKYR